MDMWRLLGAAFRRWYVLVPLLAITGVVAWSISSTIEPEYEDSVAVMPLAPNVVPDKDSTRANPYVEIDTTAAAMYYVLGSSETRDALEAKGLPSDYEIEVGGGNPVLQVLVRAD